MSRPGGGPGVPAVVRHVLLDRDGVLNEELSSGWLDDPRRWSWAAGSEEGLARLARAGVEVSVVTNQSGIGRGAVTAEAVDALHRWLASELARRGVHVVGIYTCPHAPLDACGCRKPAPGLLEEALAAGSTDRREAVLVGDDHRDLEAAEAAGLGSVLVRTGKGRSVEATGRWAVPVFDDLDQALAALLPGAVGARAADA